MGLLRSFSAALRRPPLFSDVDESFWRDPYISKQILEAHLDPVSDDASRRPDTIARSTEWIAGHAGAGARLLDLGCGPGLYCQGFARRGMEVCGLDYSRTAVEYARGHARRQGLAIDYRVGDYRRASLPAPFDLITLIYGGFCCITNVERDDLLARVRRSLSPGGLFVFDVFTRSYIERGGGSWYIDLRNGFWRPGPHLVVERKFDYPEADVHLDRFVVTDRRSGVSVYNMWKHYYSKETVEEVLVNAGFEAVGWHGDLAGAPFDQYGPWIGIVARPR